MQSQRDKELEGYSVRDIPSKRDTKPKGYRVRGIPSQRGVESESKNDTESK